jgi:hypothetical protein
MDHSTRVRNLTCAHIVVKGFYFARGRINVVKSFMVGTPREAVGDGHAAEEGLRRFPIKRIERAIGVFLVHVHCASEEAASGVTFAVVDAVGG